MAAANRRRPTMAALVLGAAAVAVVIVGVSAVGSTPARTVRQQLVAAKRGVVQSVVSGSGTLSPAKQADVDFRTSGTISAIHVKAGQHVSSGETLANLDSSAAEVQVASAQAAVQSAEDDVTNAETAAATTTTTTTKTAASTGSGGGSTMSVAAAQAALASAQLTLRNAETALENTALHAPIGGTVASINGAVGDTAGGGSGSSSGSNAANAASAASSSSSGSTSSPFIVLAQVHHFKMDVSLTESDIGSVKVGQPATVTVNAADGQEFSAHVSAIGVLASTSSSSSSSSSAVSYPVTLTLDQGGSRLKPGMSASADIITKQQDGVSIPTQAIQGSTVTVERNGKQERVPVQTGIAGNSNTIIASGVKAGEQVVVTSASAAAGAAAAGAGNAAAGGQRRLGGGAGIGGALGGAGFRGGGLGGGPPGAGGG